MGSTSLHILVTASCFAVAAKSQCNSQWLPINAATGVSGSVHATTAWDPDGSGPQRPRLVIGGAFGSVWGVAAANIAALDPDLGIATALGAGLAGTVHALTTLPNGDLVAGGSFLQAGATWLGGIARWNGTAWSPIGGGVSGFPLQAVYALAVLPNGDLVAGGLFTSAGGAPTANIARWNGAQWQPLGSGTSSAVTALVAMPNGDLVAGGAFTQAGGAAAYNIARWTGNGWQAMGTGADSFVSALAMASNGDLVVGGGFTSVGGTPANRIARWDGTSWSALGAGCDGAVLTLLTQANGDVVAGGEFTLAGGIPSGRLARWSGSGWQALGNGCNAAVRTLAALPDGDLALAGDFTTIGATSIDRLARLRAGSVRLLAGFTDPGAVGASLLMPNGDLVVGVGTTVRRWTGAAWDQLGGSLAFQVHLLAVSDSGTLAAGGSTGIAVLVGTTWTTLPPITAPIRALCWTPTNLLLAADNDATPVQAWNGASWSPIGTGLPFAGVTRIAVRANGDIVVGGAIAQVPVFTNPFVAAWNGTSWQTTVLASSVVQGRVNDLLPLANGDVVVVGTLAPGNHAMLWNGTTAQPLGNFGGQQLEGATSAALLPTREIVASSVHEATSRWNGTNWVPLALQAGQTDLLVRRNGEIVDFGTEQRFVSTCFAASIPIATACVGPFGPVQLQAGAAPWVGTTFQSTATGLLPGSLAFAVLGLGPLDLPLAAVSPAGLPNCNLLATPDLTTVLIPSAGASTWNLAIPGVGALIGAPLFHQFVQIEVGGPTGIQSLSVSNALQLAIGGF